MLTLLLLAGLVAGVALVAGTIAAVFRVATGSAVVSVAAGTLALPALLLVLLAIWVLTMEAGDPAPGNVLAGVTAALALVTPAALAGSRLANRLLRRR